MKQIDVHESFERTEEIERGSNRGFGAVFAVVFGLIAGYQAWNGGVSWPYWAAIAGLFAAATLLFPGVLAPLNNLWMRLAVLLSKVITPIIMALLFYGTVLPTGLIMRMLGKDPLRLRWHRGTGSYWIPRTPPGPDSDSLRNQF